MGFAGAAKDRLDVWCRNWSSTGIDNSHKLKFDIAQAKIDFQLNLSPSKDHVLHGNKGLSKKGDCAGCASHYYSFTRMDAAGSIRLGDQIHKVSGYGWMDHEFMTNAMPDIEGWDWFSILLPDNRELMLFHIRGEGGEEQFGSGTLIDASGQATALALQDFSISKLGEWISPHTAATYSSGWAIQLPAYNLNFKLLPLIKDQEIYFKESKESQNSDITPNYWEGAVEGRNGIKGFVELTGYDKGIGRAF